MSPRIAYWTSSFEPEMEAIAAEVAILRRRFPGSVAWGLSKRHWALFSWRRGYCLNPKFHLLFRAATRLLERTFELNHILGSVGDWFYLQGSRRRPIVLTAAAAGRPVAAALLQRVDRFVVEHPRGREELKRLGIDESRIRLILPPVDLGRFIPEPAPEGPFTVLFASSPDDAAWLDARGVPQILEAAALRPRLRFRLLWRPWGDSEGQVRRWIAQRGLGNVELEVGYWKDMAVHYQQAHATLAPFTDLRRAKRAPNSVVESLACGRPVIVTEAVGLAELIREGRAGIVCGSTGLDLAEALDRLQADWQSLARNARAVAERWFGVERFLDGYQRLYDELLAN